MVFALRKAACSLFGSAASRLAAEPDQRRKPQQRQNRREDLVNVSTDAFAPGVTLDNLLLDDQLALVLPQMSMLADLAQRASNGQIDSGTWLPAQVFFAGEPPDFSGAGRREFALLEPSSVNAAEYSRARPRSCLRCRWIENVVHDELALVLTRQVATFDLAQSASDDEI